GTFSSPSPSRSDAVTAFASEDASLPDAIGGLSFLKSSIGGLSCLKELHLAWNNFSSLPESTITSQGSDNQPPFRFPWAFGKEYHAFPGKVEACLKLLEEVDSPELLPCQDYPSGD
ncbi:hypothetical protein Tco_0435914, partial [Tanacetum coccineum]